MLALTEGVLPFHRVLRSERVRTRPEDRSGFAWWRFCMNTAACWPHALYMRWRDRTCADPTTTGGCVGVAHV